MQSDIKYGSVHPGREIRSDLWSVEYFVARGWQPTPNLTTFDIFSKAVKQLSHKCASVSELTHGSFILLMSGSKLEIAECLQRRHSCTPNREGRYFNSTPVRLQLTYLVSRLSGTKLQTWVWQNQKSCVSRLTTDTVTYGHVSDLLSTLSLLHKLQHIKFRNMIFI